MTQRSPMVTIAGLVVLTGLLYVLYAVPGDSERQAVISGKFKSVDPGMGGPVVKAWIASNQVLHGQPLSVSVTFENHSQQAISSLAILSFVAPGFDPKTIPAWPAFDLPAGSVKTLDGQLYPLETFGRFSFLCVFEWSGIGGQRYRGAISPGSVEVTTEAHEKLVRMASRASAIGKDLTIPIVLAWLGYWFQRRQGDRDQHAREEQERLDRRQQIWNSILPRFHEYAENHYLPIVASIRLLNGAWEEYQKCRPPADVKPLLFRLLIVLRRVAYLREKRGGVFFQDRAGEQVMKVAWLRFFTHIENRFTLDARDQALSLIAPSDDYPGFLKVFRGSAFKESVLEEVWVPRLSAWIAEAPEPDGLAKYLTLLEIVRCVVLFEANRPFDKDWYGSAPTFELKEASSYDMPASVRAELTPIIDAYARSVKKYIADETI